MVLLNLLKYKNYLSEQIIVTSGVSPADNLSPILFSLFIDDICISDVFSQFKILLLADDTIIFKNINYLDDVVKLRIDLKIYKKMPTKWYVF